MTDAEFTLIEPMLLVAKRPVDRDERRRCREVLNAILYVLRTGTRPP